MPCAIRTPGERTGRRRHDRECTPRVSQVNTMSSRQHATGASLIYSMSVSVDGYVADRDGDFGWTAPSDDLFQFHLDGVAELGCYLMGRKLYEAMRVWETEPAMRVSQARTEFADIWCALPKVVFSRTLTHVEGNARLADGSVAEEIQAALAGSDRDVSIGGPELAATAIGLGLVDEYRIFRFPISVGGGSPHLPPLSEPLPLDLISTRTFASRVVFEQYRRRSDL